MDSLWGIEDRNLNIVKANHELENIGSSSDMYSIGRCFGGHHICLSSLHFGVYLFTNGIEEPLFKLFDNVDNNFFNSLEVEQEEPIDPARIAAIKADLRF